MAYGLWIIFQISRRTAVQFLTFHDSHRLSSSRQHAPNSVDYAYGTPIPFYTCPENAREVMAGHDFNTSYTTSILCLHFNATDEKTGSICPELGDIHHRLVSHPHHLLLVRSFVYGCLTFNTTDEKAGSICTLNPTTYTIAWCPRYPQPGPHPFEISLWLGCLHFNTADFGAFAIHLCHGNLAAEQVISRTG